MTIPVVELYEAHCIAASTSVNAALAHKLKLLKVHQLNLSCISLGYASLDLVERSASC